MISKKEAAKTAAQWWAWQLVIRPSNQNTGSGLAETMLDLGRARKARFTEVEALRFRQVLEEVVIEFLEDKEWDEDNPAYGAYYRTVSTAWDPDARLRAAIKKAGLNASAASLALPVKTVMHLDPTGVTVRRGAHTERVVYDPAIDAYWYSFVKDNNRTHWLLTANTGVNTAVRTPPSMAVYFICLSCGNQVGLDTYTGDAALQGKRFSFICPVCETETTIVWLDDDEG